MTPIEPQMQPKMQMQMQTQMPTQMPPQIQPQSPIRAFYSVFHSITMMFALYLSFKCNKGFSLGDFLLACCCPVIYIVYRAATSNFCQD